MDETIPMPEQRTKAELRQKMLPSEADTADSIARWHHAKPDEHGRVLWGLLEYADRVNQATGDRERPRDASPSFPIPVGDPAVEKE